MEDSRNMHWGWIILGIIVFAILFHSGSSNDSSVNQQVQDLQDQVTQTSDQVQQMQSDLNDTQTKLKQVLDCNDAGGTWKYGYCSY